MSISIELYVHVPPAFLSLKTLMKTLKKREKDDRWGGERFMIYPFLYGKVRKTEDRQETLCCQMH